MDPARLRSGIAKKIDKNDFFIYVHTVNSLINLFNINYFLMLMKSIRTTFFNFFNASY